MASGAPRIARAFATRRSITRERRLFRISIPRLDDVLDGLSIPSLRQNQPHRGIPRFRAIRGTRIGGYALLFSGNPLANLGTNLRGPLKPQSTRRNGSEDRSISGGGSRASFKTE